MRTESVKQSQLNYYNTKIKGHPRTEALKLAQIRYREKNKSKVNAINAKCNRNRYYYSEDSILRDVRRLYM